MNNEEVLKALEHLIGMPYEPSIKDTIRAVIGHDRVVGPDEFKTREFDPRRISISVDGDKAVQGFHFG